MKTENLEKYLNSFGNQVVQDARDILGVAKGGTALAGSIRFKVVRTEAGFTTKFYMYDYGEFVDKGVSGTEVERSFTNYQGRRQASPGKGFTTKQPPSGILEKWIKRKGLKGRDMGSTYINKKGKKIVRPATGRFITDKSFAFAIAKSIKKRGIRSLSFFQKPLGIEYKKLENFMLTELKLDIETYLTTFYRPK